MKPLVSIIIPVFNAEKYLAASIRSAIDQTWDHKEILIIDDGSTDGSLELARQFESKTLRVFSQPKQGASAARNKGLAEARGEYIQFLDADDLISPDKISLQIEILHQHPGCIALGPTVYFMDGEDPFKMAPLSSWTNQDTDDPLHFLIKLYGGYGEEYAGMVALHAWLTPASVLKLAGTWNTSITVDDDGEYFCRVLLNAKGIRFNKDAMSYYRKYRTANNQSRQSSLKALESMYESVLAKSRHILSRTVQPEAKKALSRLLWEVAVAAYPKYLKLSDVISKEAKELWPHMPGHIYRHTQFYRVITGTLGWKASAWFSYLKHRNPS